MAGGQAESVCVQMTASLVVRPEAEADIHDGYQWYESQSVGLGLEFLRSIEATLASVERMPELYAKIHRDMRRVLVRRFPYAVFYVCGQERIAVLAVMHVNRHPRRWQSRLSPGRA